MFPILTISGDPLTRGRLHGAGASAQVKHSIKSYARLFAHRRGITWSQACEESERYLPALRKFAPDLIDEMRGIAIGSGRAFNEILALNVRTELLSGIGLFVQHPGAASAHAYNTSEGMAPAYEAGPQPVSNVLLADLVECTTAVALPPATTDGGTLLAQTWDWSGDQRAACVVLKIKSPDAPDAVTVTEAGILAKIGMNAAGLGVALNILASTQDGKRAGVPVHVMLRKLLQMRSMAEARALLQGMKPAGSSCITVAHAEGSAASYEVTPQAVAAILPQDGVLAHSNHCIAEATLAGACALPAASSSKPRLNRATDTLRAAHGRVDSDTLEALLRDESDGAMAICRKPNMTLHPCDRMESVLGAIMNLNKGVMLIADNVPSLTSFEPIRI